MAVLTGRLGIAIWQFIIHGVYLRMGRLRQKRHRAGGRIMLEPGGSWRASNRKIPPY